jgi:hypothetical protein
LTEKTTDSTTNIPTLKRSGDGVDEIEDEAVGKCVIVGEGFGVWATFGVGVGVDEGIDVVAAVGWRTRWRFGYC